MEVKILETSSFDKQRKRNFKVEDSKDSPLKGLKEVYSNKSKENCESVEVVLTANIIRVGTTGFQSHSKHFSNCLSKSNLYLRKNHRKIVHNNCGSEKV